MKHKIIFAVLLMLGMNFCYALDPDTISVKKKDHYFGFQANQLLRQSLNLDNNPFLFSYSMNSIRTGWGIAAGVGYSLQTIKDKDSPTNRQSKMNDLSYRVGYGRRISLGKRFETAYWLDFVGAMTDDKTSSTTVTNSGSFSDSTTSTITSKSMSYGLGPRLSLSFHITERVHIGTESSFYYSISSGKENVLITDVQSFGFSSPPIITTSNSNPKTSSSKFSISTPVALFLIVKI